MPGWMGPLTLVSLSLSRVSSWAVAAAHSPLADNALIRIDGEAGAGKMESTGRRLLDV